MKFIQKFENKKGMKDYEKEFIDSKIKYIHNKKKDSQLRMKVMKNLLDLKNIMVIIMLN
jgi:hypothetical protein